MSISHVIFKTVKRSFYFEDQVDVYVYLKLSTSKDFSDQVGIRAGLTSILQVDAYKSQTQNW
jgi:hypothetical protein